MQKMHNLAARLVAVPGPRAWPPNAWAVPRVSHHLGRWPRALDLVPAALVREPWTWCRPARPAATWCALSAPRYIIR